MNDETKKKENGKKTYMLAVVHQDSARMIVIEDERIIKFFTEVMLLPVGDIQAITGLGLFDSEQWDTFKCFNMPLGTADYDDVSY